MTSGILGDTWTLPFGVGLPPLAARVRLVISRLVLVFALPLDFHGRAGVVPSMFIPAALASDSLRELSSSLANVGAILSLMDGPSRCDPAYCVGQVQVSHASQVSCSLANWCRSSVSSPLYGY